MPKPKLPAGTARAQISATVAPETLEAIHADAKPGEGIGRVLDRWALERKADAPIPAARSARPKSR